MAEETPPEGKDKQTAVLLALIPWGVCSRIYTYQVDRRRLRKDCLSVALWLVLALLVWQLPNFGPVENWLDNLAAEGTDTELAHLVLSLCVIGILTLVMIEAWLQTVYDAIRRPAGWYRDYPGRHATTKDEEGSTPGEDD